MRIALSRRLASKVLATGLALLLPLSSHAFKLNTHLWVGQQVINDLEDDGKITVRLRGQNVTLPVRDDVRLAILQNRNEYLLGNIGPDAMPDVVVGQTLMHPGQGNGWKANDWMQHLLQTSTGNPVGKAFAYGYLGHAAADVFAHTYVNQYAGDHFDLSNEVLVEERHIALEGFIGRATPALRNYAGTALGNPWDVVRPSDALASFLRDQLVYAPQAQAQYRASPYAAHLVVFKEYRDAIDAVAEDGVWREIDIAVAKYISAQFGYNLGTAQAGQVVDAIAKINDKLNRGINVTQAELTSLNNGINSLDLRLAQGAKAAADRAMSLEAGLINAQNDLEALLVEKTCDQVDNVCPSIQIPDGIDCNWLGICKPKFKRIVDPVCKAAFERTCKDLSTILRLRNEATARLLENRKKITAELLATHTELVKARESALALTNAMIDFIQIPTQGSSPIQAILRNWRADTDQAVSDYVKAATQAMINTMDPSASAFTPLQRWLDCSYPSLIGIPAVVSNCNVRDSATQIVRALDRLANLPGNVNAVAIGLPSSAQIAALRAKIEKQVMEKVKKKMTGLLIDLLPEKVQGIVRVLDEEIDGTRLNYYFNKPESGAALGLVTFPDMSVRASREMVLTQGYFNPEQFATVYDAVVLAKLALLDNAGLSQLAQHAGVAPAVFNGTDNIVANAFANIDGNHQWMDVAPMRPSIAGAAERRVNLVGYPFQRGYRSAAGFVPWQAAARDALFRGLFKGPLSPGVEAGAEIGVLDRVPEAYPYRPCAINPFPNDEADKRCVGHLTPWVPPVTNPPTRPPTEPGCGRGVPHCNIP